MLLDEAENLKIFSGNSNRELALEIADYLGINLGKAIVSKFSDGEIQVKIDDNVRGVEVFIIQTLSFPVNENLMELLIMIDALRRASAEKITAVIPYFGYAKQEKKMAGREPISAKLVANLITTAGANRVVTVDLHTSAIQGFFDIPTDNLTAVPILTKYLLEKNLTEKRAVVVSPDAGGVARARNFAERIEAALAIIFKRRPKPEVSEVIEIVGDVEKKITIIVDDMISTGGTLISAAKFLLQKGAKEVYACATHPVLVKDAVTLIKNSEISKVITTNTIPVSKEKRNEKIEVLSVASLLGEAIRRIHLNLSVSKLFS